MADDGNFLVTISGAAMSMLLYENARTNNQFGFLLGEVLGYMTKTVTDLDREVENLKQHINIKSIVAYPHGDPFFDSCGQIYKDKLKSFLEKNVVKVVGWYHYMEDFTLSPSIRDIRMHNELTEFFVDVNSLLNENIFTFCRLNMITNASGGTHKFKHVLLRKTNKGLKPIVMKINNLGADTSRPDGTDYKPAPSFSSCDSDAFRDIVYKRIEQKLDKTSGVETVTLIQKAAEQILKELIPEVNKSDKIVSELEQRLLLLREEFFSSKLKHKFSKTNQMEIENSEKKESPASPDMFDPPKSKKTQEVSPSARKQLNFANSSEQDYPTVPENEIGSESNVRSSQNNSFTESETTPRRKVPPNHHFIQPNPSMNVIGERHLRLRTSIHDKFSGGDS